MPTTLAFLRDRILGAAVLGSALSGCCETRIVTAEECLTLEPGELECPTFEEAEERLAIDDIVSSVVYPEREYRFGDRTYVVPTECCYTHESTVDECDAPRGFGRPLVIGGQSVRATLAPGDGWSRAARGARRQGAPRTHDPARAAAWRERGLLEHAAVASFTRFTLELLALGAPASLVRAAQRASLEETAHAELCFALATGYDGREVGPGPLAVTGAALELPSRSELARRLVHEGCVEETLGVVELIDLASRETEVPARRALERLARDEIRHAALGFAALGWLASNDRSGAVRAGIAEALRRAETRMGSASGSAAVWREIVAPIARAVLS